MRYITTLFMLMLSFSTMAQQDSLVSFFDVDWRKVEDGPDVFYYRKAILKDNLWYAREYYKKNNALKSTGIFKLQDSIRNGSFVYYHDNGQKEKEGVYVNGEQEGVWRGWYENGNKMYVGNYKEGYRIDAYDAWYKEGGVRAKLHYLDDIAVCKASEKTDSTGKKIRIDGKYSGTCIYYYANGKPASKEEWKGEPVSVKQWDEDGNPITPEKDSLGAYKLEIMPRFNGNIFKFIAKEVKYPRESMNREEQGRPIVNFVVEKNGEVTDVSLRRSSGYTLIDEEAMRVIRLMSGKWTPGRDHNLLVRVYYTIPITFKLH